MTARNLIPLLCAVMITAAAGDKPKSKGHSKDKKVEAEQPASSGLESLGSLIPEGVKSMKVVHPGFDQGRQSSLVTAKSMTRLSDKELYTEGLVIHLYGKQPKDNMRVDMKTAVYHIDTKMLSSDQRSKITRSDFTLEGDSAVYDMNTGKGEMKGNVHMVIFDTSTMVAKPADKAADQTPVEEPPVPVAIPIPTPK